MSTDMTLVSGMLEKNTYIFNRSTEGVAAEKWLVRPSEDSNHLLWVAGHVVVNRAKMFEILGQEWSAPWRELFLRGVKLLPPQQYPSSEALLRCWSEVSEKLSASLVSVSTASLGSPKPEKMPSFDGTVGGSIAFLAFHETYHVGQVSFLHKWLGYGQVVG